MTEPPPDVVAPEYWEIWHAACKLLEENADLIALAEDTNLAEGSDIRGDECENSSYGAGA